MGNTPGELLKSETIQPHHFGTGIVRKGETLRIVDVEGQQVADFVTIKLNDPSEYLDCIYTNWRLGRWKWNEGDAIYTNHMNPLWTITDDRLGNHYTGGGFCSRDARRLYYKDDQKGCRDTLEDAFKAEGIDPRLLQSVSCFNVFMTVDYTPEGEWVIREPITEAGDYIDLRAEMDLMWMVSVCYWPEVVNGSRHTPLRFETYAAG
ncbi:MAG: urea carboxylase-associated family protein [Alphaproteobacteria bacterium]